MVPQELRLILHKVIQLVPTVYSTTKQKNSLKTDVTFLYKSSYGGFIEEEEVETVCAHNENNNYFKKVFDNKTKKQFNKSVTFLYKSCDEWNKVEKLIVVPKHYEGAIDEEEVEAVSAHNEHNSYCDNVIGNLGSIDEAEENYFWDKFQMRLKCFPIMIM